MQARAHDEHDIVALSWLHLKLHRLGSRVFRGVQMLVGVFSGVQILVRIQHQFSTTKLGEQQVYIRIYRNLIISHSIFNILLNLNISRPNGQVP
jgi:hypothetical protein